MPSAERVFSAFLYRFRGYILGAFAIALVLVPPSRFPKSFYINECVAGLFIAAFLYVVSALLRIRARQFIGEHTRGKVHAADALVTVGPYARMRHPLYVSNTGFACGVVFFHLGVSLLVLPFIILIILFEITLARIEDRFLECKFGDTWRAWASKTPAFVPRWDKSSVVLPQRTVWQAFFADSSTWLWLLFCNLLFVLLKVTDFYV
jgi:protein-S-isoprenylcysteine O-methyltransferase Ste14